MPQFAVPPLTFQRELRRIGVDMSRHTGFVSGPNGPTGEDLLAWLRRIPTGAGEVEYSRRFEMEGPTRGLAEREGMPPPDPQFVDPEIDELEALLAEFDRLYPPGPDRGGVGLMFPHGRAAALAALRRLPTGTSSREIVRALEAPPTEAPS
jgi:hypothetical protein